MNKHQRKTSLFLIELMIALLFFAIASAVCIKLFAKAHTISADTENTHIAITKAQNIAESAASGAFPENISSALPQAKKQPGGSFLAGYDKNWQECKLSDAAFTISVAYTKIEDTGQYDIAVYDTLKNKALYTMSVHIHIQRTS